MNRQLQVIRMVFEKKVFEYIFEMLFILIKHQTYTLNNFHLNIFNEHKTKHILHIYI